MYRPHTHIHTHFWFCVSVWRAPPVVRYTDHVSRNVGSYFILSLYSAPSFRERRYTVSTLGRTLKKNQEMSFR